MNQPSLFESTLFVQALETNWADDIQPSIDKADTNADDDWKAAADRIIRGLAESMAEFTADDLVERLERENVSTHEPSALGPVFLRARAAGLIENTGRMIQSRIPRRHRKITVWRSLASGAQ